MAAAARRAGHAVRVLDLQVEPHGAYRRAIAEWQPDAVAFSCNYLANVPEIIDLAKQLGGAAWVRGRASLARDDSVGGSRCATLPVMIDTQLPADPDDLPIPYMARTRAYYQALGYGEPYRWAHYAEVPFAPLPKPLAACRVALVTTAVPYDPAHGDQGPGAPYNAAAKFHRVYAHPIAGEPDVRIAHVTYDRDHTSAADPGTWFPLAQLKRRAADGAVGAPTPRFYGVPTTRSQRTTLEQDAPDLLRALREDAADVAVLVPNCPICHQTMSLAARHLEAAGVATVVMGCARDIVEHAGVPRFLFSDFPLGNSAGKPHDPQSQAVTLDLALGLLQSAPAARTTLQSPLRWSADATWKRDFCNIERLSEADRARLRREHEQHRAVARSGREER